MASMETDYYVGAFSREFGRILHERLDRDDKTIGQAADQIERSENYVGDRLRGKRPLSVDVIEAVAKTLGISVGYLIREVTREIDGSLLSRDEA